MIMYTFEVIDKDRVDLEEFNHFKDKLIFTTVEWLKYIEQNQKVQPLILRITEGPELVGYFTGFSFTRFGIRIVASPFDGWTTSYMGFDVREGYRREDLIRPLSLFLYKNLKCHFIQITDRFIREEPLKAQGINYFMKTTLELSIDKPDEELLRGYTKSCRETLRQFERRGATIEIAEPDEQFAEEYYQQLQDVFSKQELVPTYSISRTLDLLRNIKGENLLCLRVRNPEGLSIATFYSLGYNGRVCFQGAASFRAYQNYRPNETMFWYTIRYFRDRGYHSADLNGERDYKQKFNPERISYPCIILTRYPILIKLREWAKELVWLKFRIKGAIKSAVKRRGRP